jgi:chaperonin GroEL
MKNKFSLFNQLPRTLRTIEVLDQAIRITLGPTGKNGLVANGKSDTKILTTGSSLIKAIEFKDKSSNILLKLIEQASQKTFIVSGDGSTTTVLLACQILQSSLQFLINGYNGIIISNGLKKVAHFLMEKVLEFSTPISNRDQLIGILNTALGKTVNSDLMRVLCTSIEKLERDGLILVEENISAENEINIVQGIELDRGFASSYFVNDVKNFEVNYENPYLLVASSPINSLNQIREIIEFIKTNNKPLIIVAEEINKDIISTLVLNNIQKKLKVAVVKYSSIKFLKNGLLEDLALLTHSNYFISNLKNTNEIFSIKDLGQAEKVVIKKDKSTFLISKYAKLIAKRRINELNRELLISESDYEKNIFKTRIARLSGNIIKIKIGVSNQYEIQEQRQKIENAITTIKSSLEEGILPGGGIFYLMIREELKNWAYLNLIGDEIFSAQIVSNSLLRPFEELFSNTNTPKFQILEQLNQLGYPYGYDVLRQKFTHTLNNGLVDCAKSVRSILWNSITIISTLIVSE